MATAPNVTEVEAVGTRFIAALVSRDWTQLESCFEAGLQFRALIPPGLCEAKDNASAVGYFRQWFGDADRLRLLASDVQPIGDRLGISYGLRLHEDQWYVVEQQAYCDVSEGRIRRMDLLCSGFRPSAPTFEELWGPAQGEAGAQ